MSWKCLLRIGQRLDLLTGLGSTKELELLEDLFGIIGIDSITISIDDLQTNVLGILVAIQPGCLLPLDDLKQFELLFAVVQYITVKY